MSYKSLQDVGIRQRRNRLKNIFRNLSEEQIPNPQNVPNSHTRSLLPDCVR